MELLLKDDVILARLKDYGFKYVKTEKKEVYQNQGIEVDVNTSKVTITGKADPVIIVKLYLNSIIYLK